MGTIICCREVVRHCYESTITSAHTSHTLIITLSTPLSIRLPFMTALPDRPMNGVELRQPTGANGSRLKAPALYR